MQKRSIELTEGDLRDIENATSQIPVRGHRDAETAERMVDR
jgi:hypothetical protein